MLNGIAQVPHRNDSDALSERCFLSVANGNEDFGCTGIPSRLRDGENAGYSVDGSIRTERANRDDMGIAGLVLGSVGVKRDCQRKREFEPVEAMLDASSERILGTDEVWGDEVDANSTRWPKTNAVKSGVDVGADWKGIAFAQSVDAEGGLVGVGRR